MNRNVGSFVQIPRQVKMTKPFLFRLFAFLLVLASSTFGFAQGGYNDGRVMIQGFMWESSQDGKQKGSGGYEYEVHWQNKWYDNVKSKVDDLAVAKFDLIWLPPPSQGEGAGYHPQELNNFNNNYGTEDQQKELLHALLKKGIEPIADVVINHRNGTGGWATFKNPAWPSRYICANDEFWFQDANNPSLNVEDKEILARGEKGAPDFNGSDYPNWSGARDLDHSNPDLRKEIKDYLAKMKRLGYRGWRYDMVKGYAPGYVAEYNFDSNPTFAVGECWDSNPYTISQWIDGTKMYGQADPALRACSAFDFPTYQLLKEFINGGQYNHLPAIHFKDGVLDGLIAVNKDKAVTFLENHDTGFPQKQFDSFPNNYKLMQGYAYILTHPGVPCVYWKHFFDWNHGNEIKALIKARKYAGVHSGSYIKTELHDNDYVAIVGDRPTESNTLIVKIGNGLDFKPDENLWGLETSGEGYAVWIRKTKKDETKAKVDATKPPFEIPNE
jgi:alpha-amylase